MSGPGSYTKGMPSRGQNGGAMNDSLAQQLAQTPSPSTGSRQATHSVGKAMSSVSLTACESAPRHAASAPWNCTAIERDEEGSASMDQTLSSDWPTLKRQEGVQQRLVATGLSKRSSIASSRGRRY